MGSPIVFLNADVGERPQTLRDGSEEKLLEPLDWANIACGGHAGDEQSMAEVLRLCLRHGVQPGAHPSYPDPANFGREPMQLTARQIAASVYDQVSALAEVARKQGIELVHVKPHGALYNVAARDPEVAMAIASGVARQNPDLILVGPAGSEALGIWREAGFKTAAEAFADRRYEPDGSLRARRFTDAVITDESEAAAQARALAAGEPVRAWDGTPLRLDASTICVHSDTPGAIGIARAVRKALGR